MKKLINTAFGYAIASMAFGVFYREFTKWNGFTGKTTLAVNHLHLFARGTLLFLVLALFAKTTSLTAQPMFRRFYGLYNVALPFMTVMFTVRGVVQVLGTPLSSGADAAISSIAGIGHLLMGASIVMLFLALKAVAKTEE